MTMATQRAYADNAQRQAAYRRRVRQTQEALRSSKGLPELPQVSNIPGWPRWIKAIRQVTNLLEQVKTEMEVYHGNRSERWLESDAATTFEERIDQLQEFIDQAPDW